MGRNDYINTMELAAALLALVHEAVHLSGVTDESATDCTALSDMWNAGAMLGIGQPGLSRLYRAALRVHLSKPFEYRRYGYC
jgi:hypothetical protein